jgi:two-component system alkaline phosphatase synthesis response regulator PhoP
MATILLVEDEENIASGLRFNLEMEGHTVTVITTGLKAHETLIGEGRAFDLIVLDVMIPGMDGFELCKELRVVGNYTPVLFLTAKADNRDKISGLRLGADDYMTKPFDLDELLARVGVLLRRARWTHADAPEPATPAGTRIGLAEFQLDAYEARTATGTVSLTPLEAAVMACLIQHAGRAVTRQDLMEAAWGFAPPLGSRTVDNFIMRLRRLVEPDPAEPVHIVSVRGVGYKLVIGE